MRTLDHNLDYEKKFIEFWGYSVEKANHSGSWIILDENHQQVGFIRYHKIEKGNSKTGSRSLWSYYTYIDSASINYKYTRLLNDSKGNAIEPFNSYSFYLKRNGKISNRVVIGLGTTPSLVVFEEDNSHDEYRIIDFRIETEGLYLNFPSKTANKNLEEILIYNNGHCSHSGCKEYYYQVKSCDIDHQLYSQGCHINPDVIAHEIGGVANIFDENTLELYERTWVGEELKKYIQSVVAGTVDDLARKNTNGRYCFSHFRYLIHQMMPFQEDIIYKLVGDEVIQEYGLDMFFPEYQGKVSKTSDKDTLVPHLSKNC